MPARKKLASASTQTQQELYELEARLRRLRKAFPELRRMPRLTDQYRSGEERELFELERQIAALKLKLVREGTGFPSAAPSARRKRSSSGFVHSRDYRSLRYKGRQYTLTSRQAKVVEKLYQAYLNGTPEISQATILEDLGTPSSRLRDAFKRSGLWGTLVKPGSKRGTVRLDPD